MRIIFLDDSSTFHPQGRQQPGQPSPHCTSELQTDVGYGEGREPLSAGPRAKLRRQQPAAGEEGGFREGSKPIFQKENVTFLDEKETHSVESSRTETGR